MVHPGRIVHFESTNNFRDIGGYKTEQGQSIKWGKVYRAPRLDSLTESDHEIFSALNIKTVVDFRRDDEIAQHPDSLPETGINYIHLPIVSGINGIAIIDDMLKTGETPQNVDGEQLMRKANRNYVNKAKDACAKLLKLLQNKENLPLVYHCTAGKDRTGYVTAMLLLILDIPRETILEDYLLSNSCRNEENKTKLDILFDKPAARALLKKLLEVKRDYLDSAYQEIEKQHGSIERYVEQGLRIKEEEKELLRNNLLG